MEQTEYKEPLPFSMSEYESRVAKVKEEMNKKNWCAFQQEDQNEFSLDLLRGNYYLYGRHPRGLNAYHRYTYGI